MMRLAILGASGHGKVVADAASLSGWTEIVFFDDAWPVVANNGPWDVVGAGSHLLAQAAGFDGAVVAVGNNAIRMAKQQELVLAGLKLVSVFHPSAVVSPHATVGSGTVVFANAAINACATLGEGCIVNTGAIVEHDCVVGDFSHLSPNSVLAGGVTIGRKVWVGAGATVKQLVVLGDEVTVGMGSTVLRDESAGQTIVGVPARPLRFQD
ncbi:acetyltransferase [Marinobacter nauticus]|uniref:Acetyltransferase n=2 Tax=Marinobacter nauticus TaxID=2743 RepID=A0A1M2UX56_MARNT|nr:acetyltransferase [Marinobacter nauticus]